MAEQAEVSPNVAVAMEAIASLTDEELLDSLAAVLVERTTVLQSLIDWAVPEHAYVPSKVITEQRFEGRIKSYSEKDCYGFIDSPGIKEAFGNDVFVHGGQLGNNAIGTEVNFAVLLNKDHKPQAFDITPGKAEEYCVTKRQGTDGGSKGKSGKGEWGGLPGKAVCAGKGAWSYDGEAYAWGKGGLNGAKAQGEKGNGAKAWPGDKGGAGKAWAGDKGDGGKAWAGDKGDGGKAWASDKGDKGGKGAKATMTPSFVKSFGAKAASPNFAKGASAKGAPPGFAKGVGEKSAGNAKGATKTSGGKNQPPKAPKTSMEIPGVTDSRFVGSIKSFSEKGGYGFITCEEVCSFFEGVSEVFLHRAQFAGFSVGDEVDFAVSINKDGKPQAQDLQPIGGKGAKRRRTA